MDTEIPHRLLEETVAVVLAGGEGERLEPLTRDRSKPAVPFGGAYRMIDFSLSNCLNSGLRRIWVLTQYKSDSLERHLQRGWAPLFVPAVGEFIQSVPPQLRVGPRWYEGTADAVAQNAHLLRRSDCRRVVVLSGDHIYKMDYRKLLRFHLSRRACATVCGIEVSADDARAFGVLSAGEDGRVLEFVEKPADPPTVPGHPGRTLVSMGVYCFDRDLLLESLSRHGPGPLDFGRDVLPELTTAGRLWLFPFEDENRKAEVYWRDVGTLDSYYAASMDLVAVDPVFNLYDPQWPIHTLATPLPPAKTVFAQEHPGGRLGIALDSIVSGGVIISGGRVERSILGPGVRVNSWAQVHDSVVMDGTDIGRHAHVRHAILDKYVRVLPGARIGVDQEADRRRFHVTSSGVVVVPRGAVVLPPEPGSPSPERRRNVVGASA